MIKHKAIRALYQNAYNIIMHSPTEVEVFDIDGNEVEIDLAAVEDKVIELQAEAEAAIQAQADARQSALNKLMALGLTEEEALALGVK